MDVVDGVKLCPADIYAGADATFYQCDKFYGHRGSHEDTASGVKWHTTKNYALNPGGIVAYKSGVRDDYEAGFAAGRWDILRQFPYAVENRVVKSDPVWALFRDEETAAEYANEYIDGRAIDTGKRL
jgi:hypothetical protein